MLGDRKRRDKDSTVKNTNRVGRIVDIRNRATPTGATIPEARVMWPDRQNLISGWLPVGQQSAGGRRSVRNFRVGQEVIVEHLGNSIEHGVITWGLYTPSNPGPDGITEAQVADQFDDGSYWLVDPATGSVLSEFHGPVTLKTGDLSCTSANVTIIAGTILLRGPVRIEGDLEIIGDIQHDGNMNTTGTHEDSIGFHLPRQREEKKEEQPPP